MRLFIAIEIPENIKQFLSELVSLKAPVEGVNIVPKENFHITLKFLGEVQEEIVSQIKTSLLKVAKQIVPFNLKITYPGVFPNSSKARVIWIGTDTNQELKKLVSKIEESMAQYGFKKEEKEFTSHITLARVKNFQNGRYLFYKISKTFKDKMTSELIFDVNEFVLMKSTLTPSGSIYEPLGKFRFGE